MYEHNIKKARLTLAGNEAVRKIPSIFSLSHFVTTSRAHFLALTNVERETPFYY